MLIVFHGMGLVHVLDDRDFGQVRGLLVIFPVLFSLSLLLGLLHSVGSELLLSVAAILCVLVLLRSDETGDGTLLLRVVSLLTLLLFFKLLLLLHLDG